MKVAFVGKGGSGKSTVSALFTRYLIDKGQKVLAVDADINQHFAELIGAPFETERAISNNEHKTAIRRHIRGSNRLIKNEDQFVKTTPPGAGSNLIRINSNDQVIAEHCTQFAPEGFFMHVGTYNPEGIGASCYHTDLAIFENIVSHTLTRENEWLIADMVAGTDAFAGSLHMLFDVIFMIVEPTPESTGVFSQFRTLAEEAGTLERVFVIGNKVLDNDDAEYIRRSVGEKLVAYLGHDANLRKLRQRGGIIDAIPESFIDPLNLVESWATNHRPDVDSTLIHLHKLHTRHSGEDYVIARHGDLRGQIDATFSYKAAS